MKKNNFGSRFNAMVKAMMEKLDVREVFLSHQFAQYLESMCHNLIVGTGPYLRQQGFKVSDYDINSRANVDVRAVWMPNGPASGWTTGKSICLNPPMLYGYDPDKKNYGELMLAAYGTVAHECGHVIFTDFIAREKWLDCIQSGKMWPERPAGYEGSTLEWLLNDSQLRSVVVSEMSDVNNCMEDGYIESELRTEYPGTVAASLDYKAKVYYEDGKDFDESCESIYVAMRNEILIYAICHKSHVGKSYKGKYLDTFHELYKLIDKFLVSRNSETRFAITNEVMMYLAEALKTDILRELVKLPESPASDSVPGSGPSSPSGKENDKGSNDGLNKDGTGNGGSDSGSKNGSSDDEPAMDGIPRNIIISVVNGNTDNAKKYSQDPDSNSGSVFSDTDADATNKDASKGDHTKEPSDTVLDSMEDQFLQIGQDMAADKATASLEKARINTIIKTNGEIDFFRAVEVTEKQVKSYDVLAADILPMSKRLQKGVSQLFADRRSGGVNRNLIIGTRFEADKVSNNSGRYFCRRNLPSEMPQMRIDVLVDQSGSIEGSRLTSFIKTCIAIEDFCFALDVPCRICGYSSDGCITNIYSYVEPERIGHKRLDRYRITGICPGGGTPTYTALEYMLKDMHPDENEFRLVLVLTDGESNDGNGARIYNLEQKVARKGVNIIAAGVGEDRGFVENEFGAKNFLDISNTEELPKRMCKLLQKFLLR